VAGVPAGTAIGAVSAYLDSAMSYSLLPPRWTGAKLEVPCRDQETGEQRLGAVLAVARPILQLGGKLHEEATTKSRAGNRLVFLDHDTAALLREHRRRSARQLVALPGCMGRQRPGVQPV
jgi:hypothetical protein